MKLHDHADLVIDTVCKAGSFDFDAWLKLAQRDPAAYEQKRWVAVNGLIAKLGGDARFVQLQQRIEKGRNG